ncbi:MAG: UDP-N-acetylmuramoyl-L-alanine--D-glutamate ligase [Christensenellales bacterium]|jgi:UDP-N-acetylmuramoylalanine--D-glutamate ligase
MKDKRVMVVGMAKSGIASARLLIEKGAKPVLYDAKDIDAFPAHTFDEFAGKAAFAFGSDPKTVAKNADVLVLSPGVPTDLEFIAEARRSGKKIIGEIELGFLYSNAEFVAITGTNGKTTTTALTGEVFLNAGFYTYVLGNIGIPITEEAVKTKKGDIIVAETAALQLETIDSFVPRACAVLNITEDHLNRYGTMENYTAAKERVFENQTEKDFCVLNYDNNITRLMARKQKSKIIWFSRKVELDFGVFIKEGDIISREEDGDYIICRADEVAIPGAHNLENALAAAALARCYKISKDVIRKTFIAFPGVEHRIEFVRETGGVRYINDSKGTNPDATEKAVAAMTRPTVIILGGSDKNNSFVSLIKGFKDNIKAAVVIGDTKQKIINDAKEAGFSPIYTADSFLDAVLKSKEIAREGWNVLLSPACASYDMFEDYEQRGRVFKEIVNSL